MFRKILIANRGEIACRVIRTARRLGIATAAVYSEADQDALHVEMADEAYSIGPAAARESYLAAEKIIDAALRSGAAAIHPGYGFLSENASFAERCREAGLIFIGPPPSAMRMMGDKAQAKNLMARAGVPVLPGYHGDAQDAATFAAAAAWIGFPILVKASAGGGGRGMRVARREEELPSALESARREALAAFGDGRLLLERLVMRPRHVEVQIFGDSRGAVVAFAERDCSLQRNHQKIVEETPAPRLPPALRKAMRAAALAAAETAGYAGAGTVEFLVEKDAFYFLEMNARLQVEHPVTEMISGVDLVEWQFRVAAGEPLPLRQQEIDARGCAMEARICAEDPARGFLPAAGALTHLRLPEQTPNLRIDAGVRQGDRVSPFYDSLLAKLIVWGEDRERAAARLRNALESVELVGVASNLELLRELSRDARFIAADYDTQVVECLTEGQQFSGQADEGLIFAAGAAARLDEVRCAPGGGGTCSPWDAADGWRIYGRAGLEMSFACDGRTLSGAVFPISQDVFEIRMSAMRKVVRVRWAGDRLSLFVDGARRDVSVVRRATGYVVICKGRNHVLERIDPLAPPREEQTNEAALSAPLPARVIRLFVKAGDHVRKGAPILALEAMKMEITVTAPRDAEIERIMCDEGQAVAEGARLVDLVEAS